MAKSKSDSDFNKAHDEHLEKVRKESPGVTFIGADGSPRGDRDHPMLRMCGS